MKVIVSLIGRDGNEVSYPNYQRQTADLVPVGSKYFENVEPIEFPAGGEEMVTISALKVEAESGKSVQAPLMNEIGAHRVAHVRFSPGNLAVAFPD